MFDGTDWYQRMTLHTIPANRPFVLYTGLSLFTASFFLYLFRPHRGSHGCMAVVSIAVTVSSFLLYPAFRGLNRPWHMYILTPLFAASCLVSMAHLLSSLRNRAVAWAARSLSAAAVLLALVLGSAHGLDILKLIEERKGVCMTSPALLDASNAMKSANIELLYGLNYSLAWPIYVLSGGDIKVRDLAFTDLAEWMDEIFKNVKEKPGTAIAYRYCGCKEENAEWIQRLNKSPQLSEFLQRLEKERPSLDLLTIKDDRLTEFVMITRRRE